MFNRRRLFIIGNGFDLAHGLETRYDQLLLWYLKKVVYDIFQSQNDKFFVNDNLLRISKSAGGIFHTTPPTIETVTHFKEYMKECSKDFPNFRYDLTPLLENILNKAGWADIEKIYYEMLIESSESKLNSIESLNTSFDALKNELEKYLEIEIIPKIAKKQVLPTIENIFGNGIVGSKSEDVMFVNFNYTSTLCDLYKVDQFENSQVINIHGAVNSKDNPIIFGYGDEMDKKFKDLEDKDDNHYLKNMKSFGYFRTDDYKKILKFMNRSNFTLNFFEVHVIGHSLGLSDRLLLNTIFEHNNCLSIVIHYSKKMDNFDSLVKNLSRHFNLELKGSMRQKVKSFDEKDSMD